MHGTWRTERDSVFENQARIAGAINILLLKVMEYRGRMVAMRFGGERHIDIWRRRFVGSPRPGKADCLMKRKYPGAKRDERPQVRPRFFRASNPFAHLSDAQREAASKAFAGHYEAEYAQSFAELRAKLDEVDPIQTLCHFAFYDLTLFERYPDRKSDYEGAGQHHVELLQALLLSIPKDEQLSSLTTTETFVEIGRLLIRASEAFTLRRFYPRSTGSKERHFQALSEDARIHTQAIRNWGYPEQVFRILTEMFGMLDAEWAARRGFKISNLVKMCQNIFRLVEDRFEQRKKLGRPILKAKSAREAVETYYRTVRGSSAKVPTSWASLRRHNSVSMKQRPR